MHVLLPLFAGAATGTPTAPRSSRQQPRQRAGEAGYQVSHGISDRAVSVSVDGRLPPNIEANAPTGVMKE
jgi:hypothetical protein